MEDKFYNIFQAINLLKYNKDFIFEIRDERIKTEFYEHMLLILNSNVDGQQGLSFFLKNKNNKGKRWIKETYIPFDENIKWYISSLTKKKVLKSIEKYGID